MALSRSKHPEAGLGRNCPTQSLVSQAAQPQSGQLSLGFDVRIEAIPILRRYIFVAAHQSGLTLPTIRQWARVRRFAAKESVADGVLA